MKTYRGGCHCGAVRFEVEAPAQLTVTECNCSICRMTGFQHLIVPAARFHLLSDPGLLGSYSFGTAVARHLFCKNCGIKSFYVPRSNPDGFSVNLRCLDEGSVESFEIVPFDGRHWEHHAPALAHLSRQA